MRLVLGLIKGIVIGGAVGFGAFSLDWGSWSNWVTYGVIGALVGALVGKPIWSVLSDQDSTIWTVVLKAIFGYLVGIGIYALIAKAWGGPDPFEVSFLAEGKRTLYDWQPVFGACVGGLYGAFIEFDDAPGKEATGPDKQLPAKTDGKSGE